MTMLKLGDTPSKMQVCNQSCFHIYHSSNTANELKALALLFRDLLQGLTPLQGESKII
jgi:hypothetical protein